MLLMFLVSLASVNAKCDWSKVSWSKSNTCNAYKFEVTGTVDTCYKHSILIVKKGSTTPLYTGDDRVFSYTFKDTGYYFVKVSIKNKCCGGDTLFYDYIHVTCKPKPKCDWTKLGFGYGNSCNVYKFELGSIDTCISYTTYIYSYKTGKITDTFKTRNFTKVFADTGKYKVYVSAINKCGRCDTSFYRVLTVTCKPTTIKKCDWSKIGLGYSNRCGTVTFELGSRDTCITGYSLWSYNHATHKLDTLAHDRIFRRTLDTGWYTFKASFHNKCGNCDTFIYKEIYIGCDSTMVKLKLPKLPTLGIKVSPNPADDKVIFTVASTDKVASNTYEVYDSKGKLVLTGTMGGSICVGVSNLPNGTYIVKIGKLTQKFIVQH